MAATIQVFLIRHRGTGQWYGERPNDWYNSITNAKMFTEKQEANRYSKTRQICKGVADVIPVSLQHDDLLPPTGEQQEPSAGNGTLENDAEPAVKSGRGRRKAA